MSPHLVVVVYKEVLAKQGIQAPRWNNPSCGNNYNYAPPPPPTHSHAPLNKKCDSTPLLQDIMRWFLGKGGEILLQNFIFTFLGY